MNVNNGTVPCPICGDAVQGSTLKAVVPMRARINDLEAEVRAYRKALQVVQAWTEHDGPRPDGSGLLWLRWVVTNALVTTSPQTKETL